MAKYFLESSAFVKRYKKEKGSNFVNRLFLEEHELFCLDLAIIEIRKVFYRLYKWPQTLERDVQITKEEFEKLNSQFAADLLRINKISLTEEMIEKCIQILEKVWLKSVFDLVHLSSFLITKEIYPDLIFVCSDKKDLVAAAGEFIKQEEIKIPEHET